MVEEGSQEPESITGVSILVVEPIGGRARCCVARRLSMVEKKDRNFTHDGLGTYWR
jgi:hypothetical protein